MTETPLIPEIRPRSAAMVAGIGLLLMAAIAASSNFGILEALRVSGDAGTTAANLVDSASRFRLGATGLLIVAILDIIVAWSLYLVFRGVNPGLSLLAAWFRMVYAAAFAAAINSLFSALRAAPADAAQAAFLLESFDRGWQIAMVIFALHLVVVGVLLWRLGMFARILSVLLIVASAGYLVDSLGSLLSSTYTLAIGQFTFVGEVVLILWLLIRGGRVKGR